MPIEKKEKITELVQYNKLLKYELLVSIILPNAVKCKMFKWFSP